MTWQDYSLAEDGYSRTHASSSPEGDATFDEEHPQVASSNHKQDAAKAKVDEANQYLHRLWEVEKAHATDLGP